jgi:hypothetical protein
VQPLLTSEWLPGPEKRAQNYELPQVLRLQNFELKFRITGGVMLGGIFRRRGIPDRKCRVTIGASSAKMRLGGGDTAGGLGCILPQTPSRGARDERGSSRCLLVTQRKLHHERNISQQQHSTTSLHAQPCNIMDDAITMHPFMLFCILNT